MTQINIPAQVINGHLCHEKDLSALEGQRVMATLTVVPSEPANGQAPAAPVLEKAGENTDFDPEPPPWMDVEEDVYFPMTVPEVLLEKKPLIVERGTPSIILPEVLPDD